jgi:hypothetical protein
LFCQEIFVRKFRNGDYSIMMVIARGGEVLSASESTADGTGRQDSPPVGGENNTKFSHIFFRKYRE